MVNIQVNHLFEICKSNNLIILNGQFGKDKGIGGYRFKTVTVIDYSIPTTEALKYSFGFEEIKALACLYSDSHVISSTTLEFEGMMTQRPKMERNYKC